MNALELEKPIIELEHRIAELQKFSAEKSIDLSAEIETLRQRCDRMKIEVFANLSPWERVQVARHQGRPHTSDYVRLMISDFVELHGDGVFRDDPAILAGLGRLGDQRLMIIGNQKGKSTDERMRCGFGMAHPEGYRKALRKMKVAAKFGLPILTLIDTPGAYPGIGAEERGQAQAIARNLFALSRLRVPIVCVVIGEGCSGGALGIGVGDALLVLENAYYSVISPEGCAAILWKSGERAPQAAEAMRLSAAELVEMGLIDEVVPEPLGGAHRDSEGMARHLADCVLEQLRQLSTLSFDELLSRRYERLRAVGPYREGPPPPAPTEGGLEQEPVATDAVDIGGSAPREEET